MTRVIKTAHDLRSAVVAARQAGKRVGLVPTMGALHAGHASLVEQARGKNDFVVVTIFVNPTQFAPHEDFSKYPRTLEADLKLLEPYNVDVVFTPSVQELYATSFGTFVDPGPIGSILEGLIRPEHFRGVATIVLKLFNLAGADVAYFGQKDYQQSLVIRRMVSDLNVPIEIQLCPTVREPDGLAMSSRNAYLSPLERQQAVILSRSLELAIELVLAGERNAGEIARRMRELIESGGGVLIDYIVVANVDTLEELKQLKGPAVALVAGRVGTTRLIDNAVLPVA